jgi:trk system potassium uptake protein TrkA
VRSAGDQLDCTVIEADGNNLASLEDAGIASADVLVTMTGDDEANMIICTLVDSIYPDIMKIARVRNYDYYMHTMKVKHRGREKSPAASRPTFGIDYIVNPDVEAARSIMTAMEVGAAGSAIEIGVGYAIVVLPLAEGCPLEGMQLKNLSSLEDWNYLVAFIDREGEAMLPNGETVLQTNDHVGILARKEDVSKLLQFTGSTAAKIDRVAIFGADNISALTVAAQMEKSQSFWNSIFNFKKKKREILVIDKDPQLCREMSEKFPDARILNGDITDDGLLQNEGVCECDLMVAASGNYERNLLTAAYLKLRGVSKVIALTSDSAFDEIASKLGVNVTVPMRDVVIDSIMSHLRGRNINAVHSVGARKFEIVTCEIASKSKVAGKTLRDIGGLDGSLMLLVKQPGNDFSEIPHGGMVLQGGAQAVIIMPAGDSKVLRMFAGKLENPA